MASTAQMTTGQEVRLACRRGDWSTPTSGLAPGYAQANLVVLRKDHAFDFLSFCRKNPKPCPLLDMTEPGDPVPRAISEDADVRTDLPSYLVWENGEIVAEVQDINDDWRSDFVAFFLGCSFTFESALQRVGIPVRHIELGCNVPMFRTNVACRESGVFQGPLVVSMRPLTPQHAIQAVQITSRYPDVHGAPVHLGYPEQIGIVDLQQPDYGDPVPVSEEEMPVFWACGVTPQAVLAAARLDFAITHSPGCMFVSDRLDETLAVG